MSYKSDGGRIPKLRDSAPQSRNMTSPVIQSSSKTLGHHVAVASRLPFLKTMGSATRSLRTSSFSDAEHSGSLKASSAPSRSIAVNKAHSSLLPRASTHPPPSTSEYTSTKIYPARSDPESAFATIANQQLASTREKSRNVLRRRAPTIGQSNDQSKLGPVTTKPGKLSVIIPSSPSPTYIASGPSQSAEKQTTIAKQKTFPVVSQSKVTSKVTSQATDQGPRELASLRATSATQNLPPPTPVFASASSPSTRYSGSPGIWSRTSTPTSLSSYSPGIVHSAKVGPRFRHPSPSQSRLPVFSPSTQHSTFEDDWMDSAASGFPGMISGAEANISLLKDKHDGSLRMDDLPKTPTFSGTKIPQRMQTPSNLPRMRKAILAKPLAAEEEPEGRIIEDHGIRKETKGPIHDSGLIPSRPSREGTHRLMLEPSPVIQSSLAPATLNHKRRGSGASSVIMGGNKLISNPSAATSVDSLQSRTSSRLPALIQNTPEVARKSPHILTKEFKAKPGVTNPIKPKRFGLFPKTSKSDMNGRKLENNQSKRKGPAAGTGHEGYGRYTQRGRRSSVSSSDSRARSTSTNGTTSRSVCSSNGSQRSRPDLDLDDFLLDRLEPVIITGGGGNGATLAKTRSVQSMSGLTMAAASVEVNPQPRTLAGYSTESLATSVVELKHNNFDQVDHSSAATHATGLELPNPTAKAAVSPIKDMLATQDILCGKIYSGPGTKIDESVLSMSSGISQNNVMASESPCQPDQRPKKAKGLKWSFFHRNGNAQKEKEKMSTSKIIEAPLTPKLHAAISLISVSRPVAHYALVDTDSDPLEEIFHHLEESPPTEIEDSDSPVEMPAALNIRKPSQSILLPSPPKLHGEFCRDRPISPKVYFNKDPLLTDSSPNKYEKRPRRLASVGRIPEVVSRRDRPHKPAMQSFSRPFSLADSPSLVAPVTNNLFELQNSSQSAFPSQAESPAGRPVGLGFNLMQPFGDPIMASALDFIAGPYSRDEFLAFSPRHDSMVSMSSGSETLAAVTAVLPKPGSEPTEDEIWGEYDDLIDHVLSPDITKSDFSNRLAEDEKLGLVTMASKALQAELNTDFGPRSSVSLSENPTVALTPSSPQPSESSFRLRRSTIVSALHSSITPSSQPSFSDIIASYCYDRDEKQTGVVDVEDHSISLAPVERQAAFLSSSSLNLSETFETCRQRNTVLFDIAERDREGPTAQTNIRSGSLMTSRWLSFGRVLFSPAHNHVRSGEHERILVIDGLGNDDWSFYCALTYPNADVYCLTDGPATTASKHPAAWQPPANHHTVYQASLEQRFPFSKGYFVVTVLRFPPVCPDSVQNNLVSECKRVLRPGGYMEMSLLDLDMVNMGIQTRKAVRNLKERTYLFDSSISLKPASDSIQKLLGRHGFDNLRRCMVRIPVTGVIVRSSGSSTSTSSSNPSTLAAASTSSTAFSALTSSSTSAQQSKWHGKSPSNDTDLSLGDLLSDPSPSPSNDESIRKIVTKVGRWWYTRCYEIPVLPNGDAGLSIWANKRVLRECQKRGTGFRLLIAYAQKPSEVKRRTASV